MRNDRKLRKEGWISFVSEFFQGSRFYEWLVMNERITKPKFRETFTELLHSTSTQGFQGCCCTRNKQLMRFLPGSLLRRPTHEESRRDKTFSEGCLGRDEKNQQPTRQQHMDWEMKLSSSQRPAAGSSSCGKAYAMQFNN